MALKKTSQERKNTEVSETVFGGRKRRACEADESTEEDYRMCKKEWELSKDDGLIQRKASYLILFPVKLCGQNMSLLKSKEIFPQEVKISL